MDFDVLKRVLAAFETRGVRYAIFGAVALNLHGLSRSTEDLDVFIAPDETKYFPPGGAFHIDIVTRLGEAFRFDDLETERAPYEDLTVTVVTPRMLYRMKRDTARPKDKADASAIRQHFDLDE